MCPLFCLIRSGFVAPVRGAGSAHIQPEQRANPPEYLKVLLPCWIYSVTASSHLSRELSEWNVIRTETNIIDIKKGCCLRVGP